MHQYNSDVPNYATATGTAANPLLYQFQSNGVFNQNQLVTNVNYRGKYGSLGSYYVLNFAKSDTGGAASFASVPNVLSADYGRASFDVRNRVFMFGSFPLPHLITIAPFLVAQSGQPYNITSGQDVYHDNIFNSRAALIPNGTATTLPVGSTAIVKSIGNCGTFGSAGALGVNTLAPVNYCTGPADFTLNLRVAKTFGFGESRKADASQNQGGGGQGGPPGGGRGPGGGGGGGGPRGGGGGGFGGGSTNSGRKYNLTIGAQAANLFNIADRSTPIGTLTSPLFGISNQLAGNIYTTDSAIRRVSLQASFTF